MDRTPNDPTFRRSLGLALSHKIPAIRTETVATLVTDEAFIVPLAPDGADHNVLKDRLLAAQASRRGAPRMTLKAPRKPDLFHKRSVRIEGLYMISSRSLTTLNKVRTYITAFGTEKMTNMPLGPARNDNFAFNRGLTALAPGAELLMEIQMTIEAQQTRLLVVTWRLRQSLIALGLGLLIKGDTF